jgi:hypothetical protein
MDNPRMTYGTIQKGNQEKRFLDNNTLFSAPLTRHISATDSPALSPFGGKARTKPYSLFTLRGKVNHKSGVEPIGASTSLMVGLGLGRLKRGFQLDTEL